MSTTGSQFRRQEQEHRTDRGGRPCEAEWNLDVVEALFDFDYVKEERAKRRRDAVNAKLKDAGKPPLP